MFPALRTYWPNLGSVSIPQAAFLFLDQREAFYGGAAGGGKSDALLAAALQYADRPGYAALILRRSFPALSQPGAIMDRSHQWLTGKAKWKHETKTWTFSGGGTLTFGYLDSDTDVYQYQGAEFQFVGFDELTQFSENQYTYLFSRLRRLGKLSDVPLRVRAASNPGGIGHGWVKQRFITQRDPDVVFIPAKVRDNPGLDVDEYVKSLENIPSEALRQQLLDGDWAAFEGAAFADFQSDVHCVDPFEIPQEWHRFESLDFGINNPTAWLAYAVDYDGNIVVYDEYYSPGLVSKHAAEIRRRRALTAPVPPERPLPADPGSGWTPWTKWEAPAASWIACYADPSVRNRTGATTKLGEAASVLTEFAESGVALTPGNNDPVAGYTRICELLKQQPGRFPPPYSKLEGRASSPRLFIVEARCPNLVEQLKTAPLLPQDSGMRHAGEIIDPRWEGPKGHAVASLRYGLMSRPGASERVEKPADWTPEGERARFLRESEERAYEEQFETPWLYDF